MVSKEFKTAVLDKNLLRTRIMLKDSLVIDPTFTQFDEMLSYAKIHLPSLFVPFDGECLENDEKKWDTSVMNEELVQLINNFSEIRINHLKKVVSMALKSKVKTMDSKKEKARKNALKVLQKEGKKIQSIMSIVELERGWKIKNITEMENAAQEIIKAVKYYNNNR